MKKVVKMNVVPVGNFFVGKIAFNREIDDDDLLNVAFEEFWAELEPSLHKVCPIESEMELMETVIRICFENPKVALPIVMPEAQINQLSQMIKEAKKKVNKKLRAEYL